MAVLEQRSRVRKPRLRRHPQHGAPRPQPSVRAHVGADSERILLPGAFREARARRRARGVPVPAVLHGERQAVPRKRALRRDVFAPGDGRGRRRQG